MCSPLAAVRRGGGVDADAKEVDEPDRWAKTGTIIAYEIQCSERVAANVRTLESQTRFAGLQEISARASGVDSLVHQEIAVLSGGGRQKLK